MKDKSKLLKILENDEGAPQEKANIIIVLEGGLVTSVNSDRPDLIESYGVIDRDIQEDDYKEEIADLEADLANMTDLNQQE